MAGGTVSKYAGPGHATFKPVQLNGTAIKQGDLGSKVLTRSPPAVVWRIGAAVEVKWGIRYNHGGGYQYRLCPASEPLTEDCFQKNPMQFVRGTQALEWKNSTRLLVPLERQQYVNEGVIPVGFDWAMNPIPVISGHHVV